MPSQNKTAFPKPSSCSVLVSDGPRIYATRWDNLSDHQKFRIMNREDLSALQKDVDEKEKALRARREQLEKEETKMQPPPLARHLGKTFAVAAIGFAAGILAGHACDDTGGPQGRSIQQAPKHAR